LSAPIGFSTTFILGSLHALEPGHGKSFLAAYIVGEKLSLKHIFTLVVSLFITHFFVLMLIAVGLKFFFLGTERDHLLEMMEWIGPALIILFGLFLLAQYFLKKPHKHAEAHNCGEDLHLEKPALTKTAIIGLISGLIPCPTAIAALIFSGVDSNFDNAPLYILIYAIGMGISMFGLLFAFNTTKEKLAKRFEKISAKIHPQLFSALLITIIGVVYLIYNLVWHSHI